MYRCRHLPRRSTQSGEIVERAVEIGRDIRLAHLRSNIEGCGRTRHGVGSRGEGGSRSKSDQGEKELHGRVVGSTKGEPKKIMNENASTMCVPVYKDGWTHGSWGHQHARSAGTGHSFEQSRIVKLRLII